VAAELAGAEDEMAFPGAAASAAAAAEDTTSRERRKAELAQRENFIPKKDTIPTKLDYRLPRKVSTEDT
jgi:hypothetical protein